MLGFFRPGFLFGTITWRTRVTTCNRAERGRCSRSTVSRSVSIAQTTGSGIHGLVASDSLLGVMVSANGTFARCVLRGCRSIQSPPQTALRFPPRV